MASLSSLSLQYTHKPLSVVPVLHFADDNGGTQNSGAVLCLMGRAQDQAWINRLKHQFCQH